MRNKRWLVYGGLGLLVILFPFSVNSYILDVTIKICLYMVLALGLNIVPGFCGLLDLGYVGFFATGAYTTAILVNRYGWSYWWVIPLALLSGAIWGILLGAPTLRLTGDYFAIVTFGFSELVVLLTRNWGSLTGGARGFPGIKPPSIGGYKFPLVPPIAYFYLIVLFLILTIFVMIRLSDSRLGRAWFAIREDEVAAESLGINIMWYKTIAFAISASFGGLAGSFYATYARNLHWTRFQFWESIIILCMIVLGGLGSIKGVMLGATILVSLAEFLRFALDKLSLPPDTRYLFYGIIMIVMMRFRPEGLLGTTRVKREMHKRE
ncbi:MAG: branched-chain amino acid ABC transporter permease [bacterium]|nr:branched-chain amino acid ABC transporter permease [bacterium]